MARVAVAGHLCLDLIPELLGGERIDPGHLLEVGPLSIRLGGSAANTGGDLADLGVPVDVFATVGNDDLGVLLRRMVEARPGMTPRLREVDASTSSYSLVFESPGTDRTFWHHVGSNASFDGSEVQLDDDLDLVHLGYPNLLPALLTDGGAPMHALLERLRGAGVTTSLDLAVIDPRSPTGALDWEAILRLIVPEVDVITPSIDDLTSALPGLAGSATPDDACVERLAQTLLNWGAAVVAVSAGARGVFLCTGDVARLRAAGRALPDPDLWVGVREWVPPYAVTRLATTTGAGDAATAGLLHGVLAGLAPRQAGALAMGCAAAVVSGRRPTPQALTDIDPDLWTWTTGPHGRPASPPSRSP